MSSENDPLLTSNKHVRTVSGGGYYFLNKSDASYQGVGTSSTVTDNDAGPVIEGPPIDSNPQEFAPRILQQQQKGNGNSSGSNATTTQMRSMPNSSENSTKPWWNIFQRYGSVANPSAHASQRDVMSYNSKNFNQLNKTRKAPIKIEPKVFFSNERTFIAWMHVSIILAGGSIAILAFAEESNNPISQLYGIILLPVAISFIVYSMYQFQRRAKMIRTRHPGPYEDTIGPAVLGIMLMLSITAQFALKLYSMHYL
jgi:uncharacterized membrane protein YidH (DUF202 family)